MTLYTLHGGPLDGTAERAPNDWPIRAEINGIYHWYIIDKDEKTKYNYVDGYHGDGIPGSGSGE